MLLETFLLSMSRLQLLVMGNEDTLGGFPVRQVPHLNEQLGLSIKTARVENVHNLPGGASADCAPEDGAQL